jgi:D-alanyl-D-alanine carboxypeptidase (penicillin-binding protein 5/6)
MVQNGSATSVPLFTEAPVFANLPTGQDAGANLSLRYRGPIEAPIRQGDEVATLRIAIAGQEPHDVPLIAGADVGKANAWQRLRNGIAGLFR